MEFIRPVNGYLVDHLQVELIMDLLLVSGFLDGESCFHVSIIKNKKLKFVHVRLFFCNQFAWKR